jgi:hypothetical protein
MKAPRPHDHNWQVQPEYSGRKISRYRCTRCGAWAHRQWTRAARGELRVYAGRTEPDPAWRDGWGTPAETALPRQTDDEPEAA